MMLKYLIFCCLHLSTVSSSTETQAHKRILFFGDSLTEGLGVKKNERYTALLRDSLKRYNKMYKLENAAVSGETSSGGLRRISWLLKKPVDIFVLALGSNDGLRGINAKTSKENLRNILTKVKNKNPQVSFLILGAKAAPNMGKKFTSDFEQIFSELAEEYKTAYVPFLLKDVGGIESLNIADGIHPNAEGHKIIANTIWPYLKEIL